MKFLVRLSNNRKVMVPVVAVLALAIFGSSYVLNDKRDVARTTQETSVEQAEPQADNVAQVEPIEEVPEEPQTDDTASPEEPVEQEIKSIEEELQKKKSLEFSTVDMDVTYRNGTVRASVETDKPGECYMMHKSAQDKFVVKGPVEAKKSVCLFEYVEAVDKIHVVFKSNDHTVKALGTISVD